MLKPENICSKKKNSMDALISIFSYFFCILIWCIFIYFLLFTDQKSNFQTSFNWVIPKLKKLLPCIGNLSDKGDAIQVYVSSHCLPIRSIKVF